MSSRMQSNNSSGFLSSPRRPRVLGLESLMLRTGGWRLHEMQQKKVIRQSTNTAPNKKVVYNISKRIYRFDQYFKNSLIGFFQGSDLIISYGVDVF